MKNCLVIGASGFVGRHVALALAAKGHRVRCLARTPAKVKGLGLLEVVQGDVSDGASLAAALKGMDAVYVSIHTLSAQKGVGGFDDLEHQGLINIVAACKASGTTRLIYVTALGTSAASTDPWGKQRWGTETMVLGSGLDVTVIRPGQIVGVGGLGFDTLLSQAKKPVAMLLGRRPSRLRAISVHDLADAMVEVLEDPKAFGLRLEVGSDDVLTKDEMVDLAAQVLGRKAPWKVHLPLGLLVFFAPLIEWIAKLPKGGLSAMADAMDMDLVGDVSKSRELLRKVPMGYADAVRRAIR